MKRILILLLMTQSLISCGEKEKSSEASGGQMNSEVKSSKKLMTANSEKLSDWAGSYSGVLPCKDCEGIDVTLVLNEDQSFEQKLRYLNSSEKADKNLEGKFNWSSNGDNIILEGVEDFAEYKVKGLFLLPLDQDGKELKPVPGNNFHLLKE